LGTWAIGGRDWGKADDEVSGRAINKALDCGMTLPDTADVYGFRRSEELTGRVLEDRGRPDVITATKAGNDFYDATSADDKGYGPIMQNYDREYLSRRPRKV